MPDAIGEHYRNATQIETGRDRGGEWHRHLAKALILLEKAFLTVKKRSINGGIQPKMITLGMCRHLKAKAIKGLENFPVVRKVSASGLPVAQAGAFAGLFDPLQVWIGVVTAARKLPR